MNYYLKEFNKKVIARLLELEAKVGKDKVNVVKKNVFVRFLVALGKNAIKLVAFLTTSAIFGSFFLMKDIRKAINKIDPKVFTECVGEINKLLYFLADHVELANGILSKLFETITDNDGSNMPTSEGKEKFLEFLEKIEKLSIRTA